MSNDYLSDSATYSPSLSQKCHDLALLYLKDTYEFTSHTPAELMEEYMKISEGLRSTYKQLKRSK
ncbi:hypothetical protein ACXAT6_003111 [Clostridium sporogenes]